MDAVTIKALRVWCSNSRIPSKRRARAGTAQPAGALRRRGCLMVEPLAQPVRATSPCLAWGMRDGAGGRPQGLPHRPGGGNAGRAAGVRAGDPVSGAYPEKRQRPRLERLAEAGTVWRGEASGVLEGG